MRAKKQRERAGCKALHAYTCIASCGCRHFQQVSLLNNSTIPWRFFALKSLGRAEHVTAVQTISQIVHLAIIGDDRASVIRFIPMDVRSATIGLERKHPSF